jgi:MFS family permease
MQGVAVGWQVYELTKDPLALGLIGLAEVVPAVSVSLYAGHIADIASRKHIALICVSMLVLCSATLFALNTEFVQSVLPISATYIYGIIFLTGIARGFASPAISSITPQIVPRELYANASAWNSTVWETGAISGPAIGGFIYGIFGATTTYAVDTLLLIGSVGWLMMLRSRPPQQSTTPLRLKESLSVGLKFVFKTELILSAITLDMFAVLFGGAVALLPIFASEILSVGAVGLGMLRAAPSVGALLTALYLAHRGIGENTGKKLLGFVAGFGLCMIFFGLSENFYLSLFLLALSGMCDAVSVVIRSVILQTYVPDDMRGRVSAVNQIFIGSSNELGAFESGLAAKLMGVVPSVVFGGVMTLGVVGVISTTFKQLRTLNRIDHSTSA